jgi:hypothetical protein
MEVSFLVFFGILTGGMIYILVSFKKHGSEITNSYLKILKRKLTLSECGEVVCVYSMAGYFCWLTQGFTLGIANLSMVTIPMWIYICTMFAITIILGFTQLGWILGEHKCEL